MTFEQLDGATTLAVARAIGTFLVAWVGARWVRRLLLRVPASALDPTVRDLLARTLAPLALLVAIPVAMDALGFSITSFIALLSTAGLAVAVGLKDSLSNIASGVLLLVLQPFREGDTVSVAGVQGKVHRVRLLTTDLDTSDGRRVVILNNKVVAGPMERVGTDGRVRVTVHVRLPRATFDADALARLGTLVAGTPGCTLPADGVTPVDFEHVVLGEQSHTYVRVAVSAWAEPSSANAVRGALVSALAELSD
ncbi:MAG: hypothetical protein RLZZ299_2391 [Pseudomonadota bacterium]